MDGFEVMTKAMKIDSETDKRNMLLYYIGSDTRKILKKLYKTGVGGQNPAHNLF